MSDLGRYIRKLRMSRHIPLRQVAQAVGKHVSYISDIELGRRLTTQNADPELLIKLSDFFKVPVTILLEKGGYEVEANKEQYKAFVKVVRNKTKALSIVEKLSTMKELLTELETATLGVPTTRGIVKSLMISLAELEAIFGK